MNLLINLFTLIKVGPLIRKTSPGTAFGHTQETAVPQTLRHGNRARFLEFTVIGPANVIIKKKILVKRRAGHFRIILAEFGNFQAQKTISDVEPVPFKFHLS